MTDLKPDGPSVGQRQADGLQEIVDGASLVAFCLYAFLLHPRSTVMEFLWLLPLTHYFCMEGSPADWLRYRVFRQDGPVVARRLRRPTWLEIAAFVAVAAVLGCLIARTRISGNRTELEVMLFLGLSTALLGRLAARHFFYLLGLLLAAAGIAAGIPIKASDFDYLVVACAVGGIYMLWGVARLTLYLRAKRSLTEIA